MELALFGGFVLASFHEGKDIWNVGVAARVGFFLRIFSHFVWWGDGGVPMGVFISEI
jgi:hypothetical protein